EPLPEGGAEGQAAVHGDRPVADRLAASGQRCEVGDHRAGAHEERRFAEPAEHADEEHRHDALREVVAEDRDGDDQRAGDDEDAPAAPVAEPSGEGADRDGARREAADHHADGELAAVEGAVDVAGHDRQQHAEREEVGEPGRDDRDERAGEQTLLGDRWGREGAHRPSRVSRWRDRTAFAPSRRAPSATRRSELTTTTGTSVGSSRTMSRITSSASSSAGLKCTRTGSRAVTDGRPPSASPSKTTCTSPPVRARSPPSPDSSASRWPVASRAGHPSWLTL